jgi:dUTP pyrophosphatase
MIKLKIKLFDKNLPLPAYKTNRAAALDLYARMNVTIAAKEIAYVPLNIALELPSDHWALLAARSSLHKKGLMIANGIGVGDEDYCGDNDEYQAVLFNFTDQKVMIKKGERIVQLIILPREKVEVEAVTKLGNKDRGGLGSTGF